MRISYYNARINVLKSTITPCSLHAMRLETVLTPISRSVSEAFAHEKIKSREFNLFRGRLDA